jgi:hypothetical protein
MWQCKIMPKVAAILSFITILLGFLHTSFAQTEDTFPLTEDMIIPIVNLDVYSTYSDANSGSDIWGAIVSGSIAPVIKFSDSFYIIPLYDSSYERQKFFIHVEEGGREYNEIQHHDLSLTAKCLLTDELTASPSIFGGWDLNVETTDEDWGDGLYDYGEFGSGVDFDYLLHNKEAHKIVLKSGYKWYFRSYPNYEALIALAATTAPEEDEKDFNAVEISSGCRYSKTNELSLDLEYILLLKYFTDKKIIDADGVLEDEEREEYKNTLRMEAIYIPSPESNFQYSLASEFAYNDSNQNFYDSRGTATLADDVFTADYFDYMSFEVYPKVSYRIKSGDKTFAIISTGYDFLMQRYSDRKAQTENGVYTSDDQRDYQHIFEAGLEIPVDENLSLITSYDYTIHDSNMDYEQYYEYNYTMHKVLMGVSLSY